MSTVKILELNTPSRDGIHSLYVKVYEPEAPFSGILQVVHGMTEYIGRYDAFMREAAERGFLCFGHDHLGHGRTAASPEELGFIAKKGGDDLLVEDVGTVYRFVKEKYGFSGRVLMGHSMGSFVVRIYGYRHPEDLTGLVIMGTGGKNPALGAGKMTASLIRLFKGDTHRSPMIDKLMFGSYNDRTEKRTPTEWLTKDPDIQNSYLGDPLTNYMFTVPAIQDLLNLVGKSNSKDFYNGIPSALPVYIVSGEEDPVGAYGKGPREVCEGLKKTGHTDVTLKLWPTDRHEVLNETDCDQVKKELLDWVAAHV